MVLRHLGERVPNGPRRIANPVVIPVEGDQGVLDPGDHIDPVREGCPAVGQDQVGRLVEGDASSFGAIPERDVVDGGDPSGGAQILGDGVGIGGAG